MALLFIDSFDHYTTAQIGDKYLAGGGSITTGRHGNGLADGEVRLALTPGHSRLVIGAAIKLNTTFNEIYELHDIGAHVCTVTSQNDGSLQVEMFGGPSARSASDVVRLGQWHYIEVDLTVATAPSGANWVYSLSNCDIYVDGAQVLNTTLGAGLAQVGPVSTYGWSHIDIFPTASATLDDLYVLDGSGSTHNAPLGDVEIGVIRPNGVGALTEWAVSGAATNWDATNDTTPDDETTKVTATVAGLRDLYAMEDVNTSDGIIGAQLLINARRTEEGYATLTPLLRHAGVTYELVTRAASPSYFYRNRDVFVTMPNGDPLTDANLNALQAGCKRTT